MLQNAYLDAKIGVDPAENEPSEMVILSPDTGVSILRHVLVPRVAAALGALLCPPKRPAANSSHCHILKDLPRL